MYYTKDVVQKYTSIGRQKWDWSIQILTKRTFIDKQKDICLLRDWKYTPIDRQNVHW